MKIAFLGDIHSHLDLVHEFIRTHPYVDAIFQVGDLGIYYNKIHAKRGSDWKRHKDQVQKTLEEKKRFNKPVYFCKGNNEGWDVLDKPLLADLNINYIPNGTVVRLGDTNIGVIGGVYSPKKYKLSSSELRGRDKRFFVEEEVESLASSFIDIDILVSHIGAAGLLPPGLKGGVSELRSLVGKVQPKWYIHGHHHYNYYNEKNKTKIQGLGLLPKSNKSYKIMEL